MLGFLLDLVMCDRRPCIVPMVSVVMRMTCPTVIVVSAFRENARAVREMALSPANRSVSVTIAVNGMTMRTDSFLAWVNST